jgi:hypothetical protein
MQHHVFFLFQAAANALGRTVPTGGLELQQQQQQQQTSAHVSSAAPAAPAGTSTDTSAAAAALDAGEQFGTPSSAAAGVTQEERAPAQNTATSAWKRGMQTFKVRLLTAFHLAVVRSAAE